MFGVCGDEGFAAGNFSGDGGRDASCGLAVMTGALHALHIYCSALAAALLTCCLCTSQNAQWYGKGVRTAWRWQNCRGMSSLALLFVWCCAAAAALQRPAERARLASSALAPGAWLAGAWLHVALWWRRTTPPILYLAVYWSLAAASSAAALWFQAQTEPSPYAIDIYLQILSFVFSTVLAVTDWICFYDEVAKRFADRSKSLESETNISYKHLEAHFYSRISFLWLNKLLLKGYRTPLENEDLGELPENEKSVLHYEKLKNIYNKRVITKSCEQSRGLLRCYTRMVWPNFYIAGLMKLFSDLIGVVPPLGLAVVIQYIDATTKELPVKSTVTLYEFFNNGYVMLFIITFALIAQALLSQNSTHFVTVEGTRLKTALQAMIYDKCMRLAPWTSTISDIDEEEPLLLSTGDTEKTKTGLLTNLMTQDTYNIMSCVWICHYIWAIPLKVSVILYLLYTKLGISALIGSAASILIITPMQFYVGKKISDNSKDISKCTDHRISKMSEILQGINVIKLYVWEDLFNEKILNLREVELKLLNKDSVYWNLLTFSTQVSTILVTVITFMVYYYLGESERWTAMNVFAGLALFNQLAVPLLILPVTVLMVIQATVSTKRIKEFLELPESINSTEDDDIVHRNNETHLYNDEMSSCSPNNAEDNKLPRTEKIKSNGANTITNDGNDPESDQFSDEDAASGAAASNRNLVEIRNAVFSWRLRNDISLLEVDDLDIPTGKLIMVVGPTGSGKSSFLSAVLGEMYRERGTVSWKRACSTWYVGQPPWLLEASVRENIVMGGPWCHKRYDKVLRATGLNPDLRLLPDGDSTVLGSRGTPLSGGQRVRVCVARALYSRARCVALDEPLGALDGPLAKHIVTRALLPAARAGRTLLLATNRLELLHHADLVIVMEMGRVAGYGRCGAGGAGAAAGGGSLARWRSLAAEARAAAVRAGAGPVGGTWRERSRLVRAMSRKQYQRNAADDATPGIHEVAGAHLLAEVGTCAGGSWRRPAPRARPSLARQLSSPPPAEHLPRFRQDVRRAVSVDTSNATLRREASLMRRLLRPKPCRNLTRWTPRPLRRLLSSDSEAAPEDYPNKVGEEESMQETTYTTVTSNGIETAPLAVDDESLSDKETPEHSSECAVWSAYVSACGWWGAVYCGAALAAQALALAADWWLASSAPPAAQPLSDDEMWHSVSAYSLWCLGGACAAGAAQAACGCAGSAARRRLHARLLHATLHAPLHHHHATPLSATLHRFCADVQLIDRKLPTAVSRWLQLALLCGAAALVNVAAAPWSLLGLLPTLALYLSLQNVYLKNARELHRIEAQSCAPLVCGAGEAGAGGATVRAGRLQPRLRARFLARLDRNHNALLVLNAANRWLGLSLDLVGAGAVCLSLGLSLASSGGGGGGGALCGLVGAHSLLLPAYLAHLAKCRADLHHHLAAVQRVLEDTAVPQEDYREDCPIPSNWARSGKIEFEDVSVQHDPGAPPALAAVSLTVGAGEKLAVCGRSGSGKSTLLLACAGAATVSHGRVLVDGVDARHVPLRALRHRLVLVPQDAALFSGTLRENLDPLAVHTDEEIWHSLRVVGLHDFVAAQPAGLECCICASGRCWSAGRVARAGAARAVLRAPHAAALLLDEPAAALDAAAERQLLNALAMHAPHTTIITTAHRIWSVRGYERAVVVERGRVAEQGCPAALLAQPASRLARMHAAAQHDL